MVSQGVPTAGAASPKRVWDVAGRAGADDRPPAGGDQCSSLATQVVAHPGEQRQLEVLAAPEVIEHPIPAAGDARYVDLERQPLANVETIWNSAATERRIVFVP
jgi:hypothetical protein